MKNVLTVLIGVLFYLIMPLVMAIIVVKLFLGNHSLILEIIFFGLIILEILAAINKVIAYKKSKK